MYIHNYSAFVSPPVDDIKVYKQLISRYTELKFRRAAVYLTTENGNLGDTETVLDQIYNKREFPMPYNFINTMSNTASFYVAQSFDILGRNFTLSSKQLSFERGLELLRSDLAAGAVTDALLGGVDEVCFSKSQFETKYNRAYLDYEMVEGSCWLLIKAEKSGALGRISEIQSFGSLAQTAEWLKHQRLKRPQVISYGMLINPDQKETLAQAFPCEAEFDYISEYGYFDSATACGVTGFLDRYDDAILAHINKDFRGQFVVVVVEKY